MSTVELLENEVLLVASRGTGAEHGLYGWTHRNGAWQGELLAPAPLLSSLAGHPSLPVVYASSGDDKSGTLSAWRIDTSGCTALSSAPSGGIEPCHLSVDPTGRVLVATNYGSSDLTVQALDDNGGFAGKPAIIALSGTGPDKDRQEAAHPHQAFFDGDTLFVIDLGADLIREYRLEGTTLTEIRTTPVPAGTGPRHAVRLPDGRLAVSGELGETVLTGNSVTSDWALAKSTAITGPARTRHTRNYPGDIQRSANGKRVYLANRSHDTVATFDVSGATPALVSEIDTGVAWPQHLLVLPQAVLVAGWDSARVAVLGTEEGTPQTVGTLFECPNPVWLHLHRKG